MTEDYIERQRAHSETASGLKQQFNSISLFRLISIAVALALGFYAIRTSEPVFWWTCIAAIAVFLVLMRLHTHIKKRLLFAETLVKLNEEEISFLENNDLPFYDGAAFNEANHLYTYDLDIFGPHSLFHHLNRTQTVMGRSQLADALKNRSSSETILNRQEAVRELVPLLDWRQEFSVKARLAKDNEQILKTLRSWTGENSGGMSAFLTLLSYALPITSALLVTFFIFHHNILFLHFTTTVFILNLILLGSQLKSMNREIAFADNINETMLRFSELLQKIENSDWKSSFMRQQKAQLMQTGKPASASIHELSRIFASLESLQNGFGAILMNGAFLYHLHAYRKLLRWKKTHASQLNEWLEIIGRTEVLNTFANLGFNNPEFCFPELNEDNRIAFEGIGHPLIPERKRISNAVDFTEQSFIILTGSNMSGKSTFLRTLGINFVLANAGAPVCAVSAAFHPMDIIVSMRLSDSLTDSESYFFAEVKRLKEIMDKLDENRCFVLLDEILRGTNSDDKRSGTIAVVKKVLEKHAIGAIATHDLEVCQTTDEYPDQLVNKCFEVEIVNNDLHFDYRLRNGICQNKSATFLMTKMGVI